MKITLNLTLSELKDLKKCLTNEIIANKRVLELCNFSDEEDLRHWEQVDNYNQNLQKIKNEIEEQ